MFLPASPRHRLVPRVTRHQRMPRVARLRLVHRRTHLHAKLSWSLPSGFLTRRLAVSIAFLNQSRFFLTLPTSLTMTSLTVSTTQTTVQTSDLQNYSGLAHTVLNHSRRDLLITPIFTSCNPVPGPAELQLVVMEQECCRLFAGHVSLCCP